ncbi:hypothetical protein DSY4567 [Desulfitobacterium hafniense Y51]|uniref:Uncharacterized protein n=1 Tax=Desulfitobacterium hafniense (strain Y51) TaxID=138119 RepID=Q24NN6_DESHY|nr:hypothetical protein DSY4567 [Desulfitobacterium hafniense Y51]
MHKGILFIQFSFPPASLLFIGNGGRNAFQVLAPLDPVSLRVIFIKVIPVLVKAVYAPHSGGRSVPVNKLIFKKGIGIEHNSDQIQFQIHVFRVNHLRLGSKNTGDLGRC